MARGRQEMHYVRAPKRVLVGLLALAFAAMIVQSAAAAPSSARSIVHPGVKLVMPAKKKHVRVAVLSTPTGNWTVPSGCTLGYSDDYVWGFTCGGNSATGSTTVPVAAPATRTGGSWAIPSGCTLGFVDGYAWGYSC
jgi:hypothetical protein